MLIYYLVVPFLLFFSYLPSAVLYKLADAIAWMLEHVVHYRKKVIWQNLRNSFPEKGEAELQEIFSHSYRHLAYRIVEAIKCFTISAEEVQKRVTILNPELIGDYYKKGRHMVLSVGHINTWEYGGYKASLYYPYRTSAVVSLVSNPYFNRLIQKSRGKFGMHLIMNRDSKVIFMEELKELTMMIFISDQSPSNLKTACWTTFLNQDSAFFTGAERYARMHDAVMVYPKIVQTKPGWYTAELILISENPKQEPEDEPTKKYVKILEEHLREHPGDWLWSHKRWKHKRSPTP
jgi:KDO2-lipid IV(A) lauroyltransferase